MNLNLYLRDHWLTYLMKGLYLAVFLSMMELINVPLAPVILLLVTYVLFGLIASIYDYSKRARFYKDLDNNLKQIDQKYLVLDTLNKPNYLEGRLFYEALYRINKSMTEQVKIYRNSVESYKEYVELWVHEVKLPIASLTLTAHNLIASMDASDTEYTNATSDVTLADQIEDDSSQENREKGIVLTGKKIMEQLNRLDNYAEQILYYARSEHASADYQFHPASLKTVVGAVAMKNRTILQDKGISLRVHDLDFKVMTDSKWLEFMINQIMSNSIKYMKNRINVPQDHQGNKPENQTQNQQENQYKNLQKHLQEEAYIEIYSIEEADRVALHIRDNGIGIPAKDLPRVFDKTFTGENGRKFAKSTGMGLYICHKLCMQMGHHLYINSIEGDYTEVTIEIGRYQELETIR